MSWQPTPQYGHSESTDLSGTVKRNLAGRHQRARGTGLHALAAAHAGRIAHGVVHVEDDLGVLAAKSEADDIVHLLVPTGAQASGALDARVEIDRDRGMRKVGCHRRARREARLAHLELGRPFIHFVVPRVFLFRHIGLQEFDDHLLGLAARARCWS